MSGPPLVRLEDVSFRYEGGETGHWALRGVSLQIHPGDLLALVGRNGSGKTTLAKHLNGLLRPSTGRVVVGETDTRDAPVGVLARQVGYVFQNPDHQLFLSTVREEVAYGPRRLGLTGDALDARVRETLERFDLVSVADRHPAMLGRGLRRLTALAAVAALGPRVLVLDEPTGGLDRRLTRRLMELLASLTAPQGGSHAVVLITHEMALVAEHATRVVILDAGKVVADVPPAAAFDPAHVDIITRAGIAPPAVARIAACLADQGMPPAASIAAFRTAYGALLAERTATRGVR